MTSRRLITVCLLASALFPLGVGPASAIEPVMEFTDALRARGYYDSAIQYLEQQQSNQKLPAEIRTIIPYEMAVTRMESVASIANPEAQDRELDLALAQLEQFVKDNPNHELAGRANTERARIFLGKARVEVWKSQSPTNEGNKAEYQANARKLVGQAKAIFTTAFNQHEKAWKEFPVYIDPEKDSEQFEARQQAEVRYMRAQLDLAMCTYEEAQTYDRGSKQFKELLDKGSREFEKIHSTYRSQVVGLYARMWEGKCFEEQGEIGKALGIYTELLGHPGQSPTMRRLQNQVKQFKLICLNHETRNDYRLVIDEAEDWAKSNGRDLRTAVGLGIRWEQIRAYDLLSERRDIEPKERDRLLRQALQQARFVNRFPGQYKDVSTFMISRLLGKLGRDAGDPEDFETAFGIARSMTKEIGQLNDEIKATKTKEERDKLTADKDTHLTETARILNLALRLAGPATPYDQLLPVPKKLRVGNSRRVCRNPLRQGTGADGPGCGLPGNGRLRASLQRRQEGRKRAAHVVHRAGLPAHHW